MAQIRPQNVLGVTFDISHFNSFCGSVPETVLKWHCKDWKKYETKVDNIGFIFFLVFSDTLVRLFCVYFLFSSL